MSKIHVAIIEDEVPAARLLHSMVVRLRPKWEVTMIPGSVEDAVRWFALHPHPDMIFLDIQLSDGNSFDFIAQARPASVIIFTTAYDQYAVRAFCVNSIDYLLKPIDEERLLEAIVKYEMLVGNRREMSEEYLDLVLDSLQRREKRYRSRFLIYGADKFWALKVDEVAYFYSENKVTFAVTTRGQEYIIDLSLNKLAEQLDPERFFRANRQVILCVDAIEHVEPYFNGKLVVRVKPSFKGQITISEEKVPSFKLWLNF